MVRDMVETCAYSRARPRLMAFGAGFSLARPVESFLPLHSHAEASLDRPCNPRSYYESLGVSHDRHFCPGSLLDPLLDICTYDALTFITFSGVSARPQLPR